MHTSGRFGTAVLAPARLGGAIPLAVHPAMTFTGTSLDLARLDGLLFAVTGPAPVLPIGQALVVEIGGEPVIVDEEARGLYHAALAHGANHLVVLVAQAAQALRGGGHRGARPGAGAAALRGAGVGHAVRGRARRRRAGRDLRAHRAGLAGRRRHRRRHLTELSALAAASGATDVPDSYPRSLAGPPAARWRAAGIERAAAQALLDALDNAAGESRAGRKRQ